MSTLDERLQKSLEPILEQNDPAAAGLSTYSDMPCALFVYDPEEEFRLRVQVAMLDTRLSQKGKRVRRVSLAECLDEAMRSQRPLDRWFEAERSAGVETVVETVHAVLWEYSPLVDHVAARMPEDPDPTRDIVLILRAGALFPINLRPLPEILTRGNDRAIRNRTDQTARPVEDLRPGRDRHPGVRRLVQPSPPAQRRRGPTTSRLRNPAPNPPNPAPPR